MKHLTLRAPQDFLLKDLEAGFFASLDELGLIAASGEDAVTFIHGQLSNDIQRLGRSEARMAGYSTPQGRLLATFLAWKTPEGILLQLPREILSSLQKRMQMYVLRAKVKLEDASERHALIGLGGAKAAEALAAWFPQLPSAPYGRVDTEAGTLIRVADAFGAPRYQWIAAPEAAEAAWQELSARLTPAPSSAWRLGDILAGVPQIGAATQDKFVAQMVNLELVGGVSFTKGCYPGQEIVARTQYLGKSRRRMLPAFVDMPAGGEASAAVAGCEVYSEADPGQPCGTIVNAERMDAERIACLVSLRLDVLDHGAIRLGSPHGPVLQLGDLPYELPEPPAR